MRAFFLSIWLFLISTLAFAQQGTLAGKVTEKKSGEGAIGATVLVTGTTQAAPVDIEGNYELPLAAGTYSITISSVGNKALVFPDVVVSAGAKTTLNAVLSEDATALKEVVVTGVKQTGTEVALIQDLKKSEVVVSGVSNDQIVKTLDRDAAEVVRRIPGVTVQNNNFIVIRGLAERYNTVMLNGTLTPSAEVDTRSFSFDILPSSVIDRILIFKSGAPELPGEFGGGVVQVFTKNSVLENASSLTVSGWARSTNTFQGGLLQSDHSSTDFLGFDNGQRALPNVLKNLQTNGTLNGEQLSALRQSSDYRNEFLPRVVTSRPDLRLSLGLNRKFEIGGVYVSNVTSLSYSNTQEQYNSRRQRFNYDYKDQIAKPADKRDAPTLQFDFTDTRSVSTVRLGIIHNYQFRVNDRNRIEFRNFFNQYGTDEVVNRNGVDLDNGGFERKDYFLHYQSRSIYSGQLSGTHEVGGNGRTTLTWTGGYNYVGRQEPDYRLNQQVRELDLKRLGDANPTPYRVVLSQGVVNSNSRFFSTLGENTFLASGQLEHRLLNRRDTLSANQVKLRVGFYAEDKSRDYNSRFFNYVPARNGSLNPGIPDQPLSTIFSAGNLDPVTGLTLREATFPQDRYSGKNRLVAGYLGAVVPVSEQFNVSGGLRVEYNRRVLEFDARFGDSYREERVFALPSLNATYNFNERNLLRAGGSISVNRPEFREIAPYTYYDVYTNFFVQGNTNIKTANIYNADLRYEFYPTRSELVSVGVFYKRFINPIEQTTLAIPSGGTYLGFQNADKAYDLGAEVEVRKSLVGLTESAFLERFSLVLNASLIKSEVQLDPNDPKNKGFAVLARPLQGQSPYVVNAGLFYQDTEGKWQVSAQYNVVGSRIAFVGDINQNPNIIDLPRNVIDLGLTKGLGEHFQLRAGVQNLLNAPVRQYYDFDRNGKIESREQGKTFAEYKRGVYSTLGLTYNF